jgi:hypothetical protein
MEDITFQVHAAEEGGYWAEAVGHCIVNQGENLDDLRAMIVDAIAAYFYDSPDKPAAYTLIFEKLPVESAR